MSTSDNEMSWISEKICCNCNYFFPYLLNGPSEYGICLKDDEFEPYIEDLLEDEDYDCCIELIEEKKFDGNRDSCEDFERVEIVAAGEEMFDDLYFVVAHVWAGSRRDGKGFMNREYDSPGCFFLRTQRGWVLVPEGKFPEIIMLGKSLFRLSA